MTDSAPIWCCLTGGGGGRYVDRYAEDPYYADRYDSGVRGGERYPVARPERVGRSGAMQMTC